MLLQDKEQTEVGIGYERKLKEGCRDNSKQCSDPSTLFYQLKSCFSGNQWRKSARAVRFYFLPVSSWVQSWENCIIEHQQSKFFLTLSAYICVNAAATEKTQSCMIFWVFASSNRSFSSLPFPAMWKVSEWTLSPDEAACRKRLNGIKSEALSYWFRILWWDIMQGKWVGHRCLTNKMEIKAPNGLRDTTQDRTTRNHIKK